MLLEVTSIKEILGLHRMGHTCANLNGELLFVWGGSNEDQDSGRQQQPVDSQLWIYDTLTGYWRRRTCAGQCPPQLSGTSSCLIGRRMFVFGGHCTAQDNWLNSLYCLDLDTFVWRDLGSRAGAEPTKPIPSDKCVSWSHNGRLFVFGGYGWSQTEHLPRLLDRQRDLQLVPDERWPRFGWNNQLVAFDAHSNKWRWPHYSGGCPSARAAHSGALLGDRYFVFGGRDSRERLNDLYCLQMDSLEWTRLASFSRGPAVSRHLLEGARPEPEDAPEVAESLLEADLEEVEQEDLLNPSPSSSSALRRHHHHYAQSPRNICSQLYELNSSSDEDEEEANSFRCSPPQLNKCPPSSYNNNNNNKSTTTVDLNAEDAPCYQDNDIITATSQSHPTEQLENHPLEAPYVQDPADAPGSEPQPEQEQHPLPVGRSFASFTAINERDIVLYGGVSSQEDNLADCWLLNTSDNSWTQLDLRCRLPRLWHTGARTCNNELVIVGGSASSKVDEFCSDVLTISLSPRPLKRMALDSAARSIRMHIVNRVKDLPSTINKLIRLRKQALAISSRK